MSENIDDVVNSEVKPIVRSVRSRSVKKSDNRSIGFEKLLSIFITISVIVNIVLLMQIQNLNSQNSVLTSTVDKLISSKSSVSEVSVNSTVSSDKIPIPITILNDKRCVQCDVADLVTKLKTDFPTAVFTYIDYNDAGGKDLFNSAKVKTLPAILFDDKIRSSVNFKSVQEFLIPAGSYYSLAVGSVFDPVCFSQEDCSNPNCKENVICRTEIKKKLDLYVMSKCPYGIQATQAFKPVFDSIPDMNFTMHYIGSYDNKTQIFTSLHGPTEVDEDLRQICIQNEYSKERFMDYVICRDADISSTEWQKCALVNSMNISSIDTCAKGDKGRNLLAEDFDLSNSMNIQGSPTWLTNNNKMYSALATRDIQIQYCDRNKGTPGCLSLVNATVAATTATVASGSCTA